jgi:hypothetical protein
MQMSYVDLDEPYENVGSGGHRTPRLRKKVWGCEDMLLTNSACSAQNAALVLSELEAHKRASSCHTYRKKQKALHKIEGESSTKGALYQVIAA